MVAEPLVHKVLAMATATLANKKAGRKGDKDGASGRVGILSFELANAMSRAASLHRSLSAAEAARLLGPLCLASRAVRALVPGDDARLLALALAEKLDALNRVAAVAARLGRRCAAPPLQGFDHVYADLLAGRSPASAYPFFAPASQSEAALLRQLDRLASATAALYAELDALADLEESARKLPTDEARRALLQRARWRRQDARRLRDASLWGWTYDKAVLLLARAVCAVYHRICLVFGDPMRGLDLLLVPDHKDGEHHQSSQCHDDQSSRQLFSGPVTSAKSGPIIDRVAADADPPHPGRLRSNCGGNMFMECLSLSSSAAWKDDDGLDEDDESFFSGDASSCISAIRSGMLVAPPSSGEEHHDAAKKEGAGSRRRRSHTHRRFGPKSTVTSLAPASTVGGSALASHYANIIMIVEKLLQYPHLVGSEARDDLYGMLPSSLRSSLRKHLPRNLGIYDAFLAHDWREALEKTLAWLAPMAHNMMRWQADRSFEQQHQMEVQLRGGNGNGNGNVLLLQTLYFADRDKTEAVLCELLVGLNYICRYEQQQSALLDCSSSIDLDDCTVDQWHTTMHQ
ncbi:hypothetical protein ACQJBY_046468 [Aegilops geniculata]